MLGGLELVGVEFELGQVGVDLGGKRSVAWIVQWRLLQGGLKGRFRAGLIPLGFAR